jgi:hypothetical protein
MSKTQRRKVRKDQRKENQFRNSLLMFKKRKEPRRQVIIHSLPSEIRGGREVGRGPTWISEGGWVGGGGGLQKGVAKNRSLAQGVPTTRPCGLVQDDGRRAARAPLAARSGRGPRDRRELALDELEDRERVVAVADRGGWPSGHGGGNEKRRARRPGVGLESTSDQPK